MRGEDIDREARDLLRREVNPLCDLSWEELDRLEASSPHERIVTGPSGHRYRLTIQVFWDTEPWQSDLYINGSLRSNRGVRRWVPYRVHRTKPGEELPDEPPASTHWRT